MKLTLEGIKDPGYATSGYGLPKFDVKAMAERTVKAPMWAHFGAGNIFRIFPAALQSTLLDMGLSDRGITVIETFDEQIISDVFRPHDNLTLGVSLRQDGKTEKRVIAGVGESIAYSSGEARCREIFESPSLQMVTMTITEKGYALNGADGELLASVQSDLDGFSGKLQGVVAIIARLLHFRYKAGGAKIALVSLDNCSHNGTLLCDAALFFAREWVQRGMVDSGFIDYLSGDCVSFNWTMIDKITPRPSPVVEAALCADGFEDAGIIVTEKNTYTSAFVNAEECQYLAVEESFPNGRPPLEKAGVMFTGRDTIDRIEKMKVCTCLNPLHTVLAVFGCLLGFKSISAEMNDPLLRDFITRLGHEEGMPVVVDPVIMSAGDFMDEVINRRFPNPFVPDTPQRIACDTSKKIPVRFGETLKAYIKSGRSELSFLTLIPLFFAGWARYLMAVDDSGNSFELSPDPSLSTVTPYVAGIRLGTAVPELSGLRRLFSDSSIFGVNLYEHGLGIKAEEMFAGMCGGIGAVRATIEKYVHEEAKG